MEVPSVKCAVYKEVETGKEGQQLNCRKFKSNQEPFSGCWEKQPPRQQNQGVFRQPETRREKGNKCM